MGSFFHPLLVPHAANFSIGRNGRRYSRTTKTARDFPVISDVKICRNVKDLSTRPACMAGILVKPDRSVSDFIRLHLFRPYLAKAYGQEADHELHGSR